MPADERALLNAARTFRAACRDPRLIRVAFEDGML